MAVTTGAEQFDGDGFGNSHAAFRKAAEENAVALINLAEGKKSTTLRPRYDPDHSDNQWPKAVHHPAKPMIEVGKTLKGVLEKKDRDVIEKKNSEDLKFYLENGYRIEPYPPKQVLYEGPHAEKAAQLERERQLQGQITMLQDQINKLAGPQNPEQSAGWQSGDKKK